MQKYTELKFRELTSKYNSERESRESEIAVFMRDNGLVHSSTHIDHLLTAGFECIESLHTSLMEAEKNALSYEKTTFTDDYFATFEKELIELTKSEMANIRSRLLVKFQNNVSSAETRIDYKIKQKEAEYTESINIGVERLKEELRLGMLKPPSATVHIEGDVGVINTGTVYGTVQGEIKKISELENAKVAGLFEKLLDTINISQISEKIKIEQMQNVELLVQQYNTPQEKRNNGLVSASLTFLSAATNLSSLWAQYGQALIDTFK